MILIIAFLAVAFLNYFLGFRAGRRWEREQVELDAIQKRIDDLYGN